MSSFIVTRYSDMRYKICIVILCNEQDVQNAVQDTFCRYLEEKPDFHDEEHGKAWLIRAATNICRNMMCFRILPPDYKTTRSSRAPSRLKISLVIVPH